MSTRPSTPGYSVKVTRDGPADPSGTTTRIVSEDAETTRAGTGSFPGAGSSASMATAGTAASVTGNPWPRIVTRPPGTTQRGSIAVMTGGTELVVVELDVPVDVVSPALGCVAQAKGNSSGGRLVGTARAADQAHAG